MNHFKSHPIIVYSKNRYANPINHAKNLLVRGPQSKCNRDWGYSYKSHTIAIFMLLICTAHVSHSMHQLQRTIIHPFFSNTATITHIKKVIDDIESKKLCYPDYSKRSGAIWTDFWIQKINNTIKMCECTTTTKLTSSSEQIRLHNPQTFFDYPSLVPIVQEEIVSKMLETIKTNGWADIPEKIFAQLFIQRCHTSDQMNWHQDPGEDFDTMANFSLVGMLSDQNDPEHGWNGGEFKMKSGVPEQSCPETDVQTIAHRYNQAILFNNLRNSHMVTPVTTQLQKTKRDLFVLLLYFGNIPMPITSPQK